MSEVKFTRRDLGLIGLCLAMAIGAGIFEVSHYTAVFPEHAIQFKVDRAESQRRTDRFLRQLGTPVDSLMQAVRFRINSEAKTFLEMELKRSELNDLLQNEMGLWFWSNRWFRPLAKEEYRVDIAPSGEILRFSHLIPEEKELPVLGLDEARKTAHRFLTSTLNMNLAEWEFVDEKTESRRNRVDYTLTYKRRDFEVFDATCRFDVVIQGDQVGEFRRYLKLPETWLRDYHFLRSLNDTTAVFANFFQLLLVVAALIIFLIQLTRHQVPLRNAVILGSITFAVVILNTLNELPVSLYDLDTRQSLVSFYSNLIIHGLFSGFLYAALVFIVVGAGEWLNRRQYPLRPGLTQIFSREGIRSKSFFRSYLLGLTLAPAFMAFQTLFYLTGHRMGVWSPTEVPYSEILNTAWPMLTVVVGGLLPAVIEEFVFRYTSIPMIQRVARSRLIAVFIPAMIWGFAHANYPNQPFWIRGAEVGMAGVVIGWLFLKQGIVAVLVWHYAVDALYTGFMFFRTGSLGLRLSAFAALGLLAIPLLINLIAYLRNGQFAVPQPSAMPGREEPAKMVAGAPEEEPCPECPPYQMMSINHWRSLVYLALVGLAVLFIDVERPGDFYHISISREEAVESARKFLIKRQFDPDFYQTTAALEESYQPLWGEYILKHSSLKTLNRVLGQHLSDAVSWRVRFYRPSQKEEYNLYIHPQTGEVVAFEHVLAEDAPAYVLDQATARLRVEEFLTRQDLSLNDIRLIEQSVETLPQRTDHTFVWESADHHTANAGDGRLRIQIIVRGDEISVFRRYYKLPEDWLRRYWRSTAWSTVRLVARIVAMLGIITGLIVYLGRTKTRLHQLPYRRMAVIATVLVALFLVNAVLNYDVARMRYPTDWSPGVWSMLWGVIHLLQALGIWVVMGVVLLLVSLRDRHFWQAFRATRRREYIVDAVGAGLGLILSLLALQQFMDWLGALYPGAVVLPALSVDSLVSNQVPFWGLINRSFLLGFGLAGLAYGLEPLYRQMIPSRSGRLIVLLVLAAVMMPLTVDALPEWGYHFGRLAATVAWIFCYIDRYFRDNPLAYIVAGCGWFLIEGLIILLETRLVFARVHAIGLIILAAAALIWLLGEHRTLLSRFDYLREQTRQ